MTKEKTYYLSNSECYYCHKPLGIGNYFTFHIAVPISEQKESSPMGYIVADGSACRAKKVACCNECFYKINNAKKNDMMKKAEEDLIITEQNKGRDEILAIEKEKCELLGIIQGKDKAIAELEEQNINLMIMLQAEREVTCKEKFLNKIAELEWQLKEITKDNDYWRGKNKNLEKENASLKAYNEKLLTSEMNMQNELCNTIIKCKRLEKENIEAKEIITELYHIIPASMSDYAREPMERAKRFMEDEK